MDFMIARFFLLMTLMIPGLAQAATGLSNPTLTNFNLGDFIIDPNGDPTNAIRVNLGMNRPPGNDLPGDLLIFIGGTNIWTNKAGIYYPTATNAQSIVVGRSAQAWWVPSLSDGFVNVHDSSAGDDDRNRIVIAAIDQLAQENWAMFNSTPVSGGNPGVDFQLLSGTNWSNPSAPWSEFYVQLAPASGRALMDLRNNGIHEFAVSNQITSVQALQLVPITNTTLVFGANQINVQSNSFISLESLDPDPTLTTISLSTGLRDGMVLLLKNVGVGRGFTLPNGSPLYDNPARFVTLPGGTWISTSYGDSMLLAGGLNGWTEVKRWGQNTNLQTDQLWELVSGHMRTVPDTLDDWQFRYGGVPQLTISTNGGISVGTNSLTISGYSDTGRRYLNLADISKGDPESWEVWTGSYMDGADTANGYSFLDIYGGTNTAHLILNSQGASGAGGYISLGTTSIDEGETTFSMIVSNISVMGMRPSAVEGQASLYYFDTLHPFTVSNIFVIKNAGTNQISFGPDARITLTNTDAIFVNADEGFSFSWRSNTVITIATNSGYSGTGANWFADDGKFHAAPGGGDVVGTLTSPKVPYATGAHAVADSNIEVANVNPARMWLFDDQTLSVPTGQLGTYTQPFSYLYLYNLIWGDGGSLHGKLYDGIYNANPEGVLTADVGSILRVTNGSPGSVLYVKETGLNTSSGWSPVLTTSSGTLSITNGIVQRVKASFSTNYVIGSNTNQQFFLLNGTNQIVTLPAAAGVKDIIYRFSMTNGIGSFVITNAADGAKIRDGISLSYTNIGVNEVGFMSDGSNWWLASKGKQIFPSASWSLGNTITPVQDVITNIPFTQLEFNNSQGIALRTKAGFTGATELAITNAGTYLITFSAVLKGSGGGSVISIWLRKDGVDVPRTRTDQGFTGASAQQCMTVNYFVQVGTSVSYFELCAASHDASPPTIVSAAANPTGYTAPAMPGVIVTINRVSDTWP